ncbi:ubiquitin carboxyl-terminal hydrolase 27-like isoform X2 [Coffea arabica]|uniref:Ubiquitin carboxyl-terminal hydrolase n=1 Tax=Coffea arabica TaxID=13443 RepID=A0ABM4V3V0_COFAR
MKIQGRIDIQSLVEKLKFGAKFLPQVNWSSPTGLHISVAASLLGATGLILAIKDGKVGSFINFGLPWSSSDGLVSSDKHWVVPGLQNLGNNCFLNVVLQALASCSSFQRFLDIVFEKYKFPSVEESAKALPLTAAVASLLEELCMVQYVRSVRSPRKVMVAMETYMPSFSLTSQQDAEEAFFHLLASLREELSESYVHWTSSLADATVLNNSRILAPRKRLRESEQQRWRRSFLGPFDGILGSILTCQSCSFQTDIEKLKLCSEDDSCDCKSLCSLRPLPWSNSYSRSFKQLSMARSPQILCVHLQRASVNLFGELVKIQGHISFPLILDLSPLMKRGLVIKSLEENLQRGQVLSKCQPPFPCPMQPSMEHTTGLINCNGETANKFPLEAENPDHEQTVYDPPKNVHALKTWPKMPGNGSSVDFMMHFRPIHSNDKISLEVDGPSTSTSSKDHTYRLVSVVQHFGKVGSGHYTVYRRVKAETCDEDPIALLEPTHARWFCISDSEVHGVSEKDVLEAEASLLFYEKIH